MALPRLFEAVAPNGARFQVWAESEHEARQFFPLMAQGITPKDSSRSPIAESNHPHHFKI